MLRRVPLLCSSLLLACGSDPGPGGADAGAASDAAQPADAATHEVCASLRVEFTPIVPTVMLVVDRSGSMRRDHGGVSRWDALYGALMEPATGVVSQLADQVRFGLLLYSGHDTDPDASCPILHDVDPAIANRDAIDSVYGAMQPGEGTPTGAAVAAATPLVAAVTEPGPRLMILATDGEPDTCDEPSQDSSAIARAEVIEAVEAAHAADIETYVIGVGSDVSSAHLQEVANAGRGLPAAGPDTAPYYRASTAQELVDAFDAIINGARGCVFELDGPIDPDRAQGSVSLDGAPLERGIDWELTEEGTLELVGEACDAILDGGDHVVEAEFTCPIDVPTVD